MTAFLEKEFENAQTNVRHIDDGISLLFGFYFAIAGFVGAALILVLEQTGPRVTCALEIVTKPIYILVAILMFVGVLGLIITAIVARLRKMQFMQLEFVHKLRQHFISNNDVVYVYTLLSHIDDTKPFRTLSLLRMAIPVLVSSFYFSFGVYFLVSKGWGCMTGGQVSACVFGAAFLATHCYLYVAPLRSDLSESNLAPLSKTLELHKS